MGLRDKHKADRQGRILKAAAALFRRRGYDAVKIEAIAAAAEVSVGTIYNYYQNKGDLLVAIVSMEVNEVLARGEKILAAPPRNAHRAVDALIGGYLSHSLVYLSKEMWRQAMAITTEQPESPLGKHYAALDLALARQTCALVRKLQKLMLLDEGVSASHLGQVIFNNTNMMFILFVKDGAFSEARLRRELKLQNRAIVQRYVL
jgi:AcrR family transcriptional regulator